MVSPVSGQPPGRCAWLLLGLALALPACRPPGRPSDAVERFYAAVTVGDCAAALGALGTAFRTRVEQKGNCDRLLEEMREHPLERVLDTQVDGRNRAAQLVRVRLRGHKTDVIIRVQAEGGQWKIFSM